jgi:hypothetical protein
MLPAHDANGYLKGSLIAAGVVLWLIFVCREVLPHLDSN